MAAVNYSILFSAVVSGTAGSGSPGDVMIPDATTGLLVKSTTAARGSRRSLGLALSNYVAGGVVDVQQNGFISATLSGLGVGAASWVRVSSVGILERASVSGSDDVVGWCETDGSVHAMFGVFTATLVNGGASFTPPTGTGLVTVTSGSVDGAATVLPLAASKGGLGTSASAFTGLLKFAAGTASAATLVNADVSNGAAIAVSKLAPSGTNAWVLTTTGGVAVWSAPASGGSSAGGSGQVQTSDGAGGFTAPANVLAGSGYIALGGDGGFGTGYNLRLGGSASGSMISWVPDGTTDRPLVSSDGAQGWTFGTLGATFGAFKAFTMLVDGWSIITLSNAGTAVATFTPSGVSMGQPVIGLSSASSPWSGMNGRFIHAMAGSTYTLAASEYCYSSIKVTGSGTNTIKFPNATDPGSYFKYVYNNGSGTLTVSDVAGNVSGFGALASNRGALFEFANGAVIQWGASLLVT